MYNLKFSKYTIQKTLDSEVKEIYLSSFVSSALTTFDHDFFFIHKQYIIGNISASLNLTLNEIDNDNQTSSSNLESVTKFMPYFPFKLSQTNT